MRMPVAAVAIMSLLAAGCAAGRLADGRPFVARAVYDCGAGGAVSARFDNRADTLMIRRGDQIMLLSARRAGSGIWYSGKHAELRGKGRAATIIIVGQARMECVTR